MENKSNDHVNDIYKYTTYISLNLFYTWNYNIKMR